MTFLRLEPRRDEKHSPHVTLLSNSDPVKRESLNELFLLLTSFFKACLGLEWESYLKGKCDFCLKETFEYEVRVG